MNREEILKCDDIAREEISIPQWNFKGYVEEMDWPCYQKYQSFAEGLKSYKENDENSITEEDTILLQAYTVCLTLKDEKGKRVFKDEDHKLLAKKNTMIVLRVATKALQLSGVDVDLEKK